MNFARLLGSLVGSGGGGALGRAVGGSTGGMVGSMMGAMLGGRGVGQLQRGRGRGMGGLVGALSGLTAGQGSTDAAAPQHLPEISERDAEVLIKAMCNAAKSDGGVDQDEMSKILNEVGDLDQEERAFLEAELKAPLTAPATLADSIPPALVAESYVVSLAAIDLDTDAEAEYLRAFAKALGLDAQRTNELHDHAGIPHLFS